MGSTHTIGHILATAKFRLWIAKVRAGRAAGDDATAGRRAVAGQGTLFPDHALEGRAGGHEDVVVPEERFGLGNECGGRLQP